MARILLVDDDSSFNSATQDLLRRKSHSVETAGSVRDATRALESNKFDLLLVDLALPDGSGLELINPRGPKAVIITGHPSVETAIRAVRGPVVDYLLKPLDLTQLLKSIDSVVGRRPPNGDTDPDKPEAVSAIIGESPEINALKDKIVEFGPTDVPVLVTGESGTGKELVAQAIHMIRGDGRPFVAVNCGAIPHELIASELFGHEKGSFTGASARHAGVFERAGEGTVFLDELGELPLEQQVALLRVLESSSVQRVGGSKEIPVNARIVSASNKPLKKLVEQGKFREDLYYRLMVLPINIPPLRDRRGDIRILAEHFLPVFAEEYRTPGTLTDDVLEALESYAWPGNVRELKHTLLRAALACRDRNTIDHLPEEFDRPPLGDTSSAGLRPGMAIRDVEKMLIEKTLQHFDGHRRKTAEALGISSKTLYNRLREYDLDTDEE